MLYATVLVLLNRHNNIICIYKCFLIASNVVIAIYIYIYIYLRIPVFQLDFIYFIHSNHLTPFLIVSFTYLFLAIVYL